MKHEAGQGAGDGRQRPQAGLLSSVKAGADQSAAAGAPKCAARQQMTGVEASRSSS